MPRRLPFVMLVLAAACRSAAPIAVPPAPTSPVGVGAAAAPVPEAIRWARSSAEHRALYLEVYAMATAHVESGASARQPGTWGVVLDADETVIDNSTYQLERARLGKGFDPASWHAWTQRREATPLPGAAAFLARVRALGGRIAIVTNRAASECPDTEAVFRAHGLAYDALLCMPEGGPSDKNPRFEAVARGTTGTGLPPLELIAFVGDNVNDFPGLSQAIRQKDDSAFAEFGLRFFVLPNAMYGSWERTP
jgi:5'-nucleotidase (lipoprotein e(P4) family)